MFEAADIFKTFNDPLAKKMRRLLKDRGIERLDVVYSKEKPMKADVITSYSIHYTKLYDTSV